MVNTTVTLTEDDDQTLYAVADALISISELVAAGEEIPNLHLLLLTASMQICGAS